MQSNNLNSKENTETDLPDLPKDKKQMEIESVTIDFPDVEDIPGQENIIPMPLGELADSTIASADEEGDNIFNDNIDDDLDNDPDFDVTTEEKEALRNSANDMPSEDNINLRRAALDNTDEDGTPLNEGSFKNNVTGTGLDVPGANDDDENEEIGEDDEENNEYSLGGDNHD